MHRTWTDDQLIQAVKDSLSWREACSKIGIVGRGGSYPVIKKRAAELGLDTSHFLGRQRYLGQERPNKAKRSLVDILKLGTTYNNSELLKRLIRAGLKVYSCERCGISHWLGHLLSLELHHRNGNHYDNRLANLEVLCPNCHTVADQLLRKLKTD